MVALDLKGKPVWKQTAGKFVPNEYKNGYAASPSLYGNLVIVAGDYDGGDSFLVAFDRAKGKKVWQTPRPARINYASPVVAVRSTAYSTRYSSGIAPPSSVVTWLRRKPVATI